MSTITAAIPVKPFDQAKKRLSAVLDADERRSLGERLARHTVEVVARAGIDVLVLSADDGVTSWAHAHGVPVILDEGSSLDRAATVARDHIMGQQKAWMVVHADLPVLRSEDVAAAAHEITAGRTVLAPSSDGGTSMIGSLDTIAFSYGKGSFHRHLAAAAHLEPRVVVSTGWSLDLDLPDDLDAARRLPAGQWLRSD